MALRPPPIEPGAGTREVACSDGSPAPSRGPRGQAEGLENPFGPNAASRGFRDDGARGTRTPDLLGAIQALSQLSYSPGWPPSVARVRALGGPGRSAGRRRGYRPRTNAQ